MSASSAECIFESTAPCRINYSSKICIQLLENFFSNNFDTDGNNDIGLQFSMMIPSSFLNDGKTFAIFIFC